MTRRFVALTLAAQLAAAAETTPAPAVSGGDRVARTFRRLDADGDGKLTGPELTAHAWLPRLDQNGDGAVTLAEAQSVLGLVFQPRASEATPSTVAPPMFSRDENALRQSPTLLKGGDHGVGTMIADVRFRDLDDTDHSLAEIAAGKPVVVALVSSSCPVSKRYVPTLARYEREYATRGVQWLLVAPTPTDSADELRALLRVNGIRARCARDESGELQRLLGARATTDAFVLDSTRTLVYRGAIDDQYGLGYSREIPHVEFLRAALDAVLASRLPEIAATDAPGCVLDPKPDAKHDAATPTYYGRIARLLQRNCIECHRAGGVAPFSLETAEQVAAKAGMIRRMVSRDLMPPWFAAAPPPGTHSPWINDRSLAAREKSDLLGWLDQGRPLGNPADAPQPRQWPGEWQIGRPDAVLRVPQPLEVNATGTMPYQYVSVETGFAEEKWVRGFEVQPSARDVVHHVLVFVQEKGQTRPRLSESDGFFAAYVPGNNAVIYPDGFAKPLPAHSRLLFQIHYTPNGTATTDQTRIGLLFAPAAPRHIIHVAGIADHRLAIPPGADNHPESATIPVPRTVKLLGFMPHMHLRGKAFRYEAVLPGGETRTLLEVPRYDFNWQLAYRYAEPPSLPAGSRVRAIGWFDNSANNPANPDASQLVRWGPQTTDEMMLGYVEYFFDDAPSS
jgi:mono/diheme cytochrome c family protein/thiol-disulfide isomerase/thioredoxin